MRTRTCRWMIIVGALALPAATVIDFVHLMRSSPAPASAPALTPACLDAEALAALDRPAGVLRLRALRDAATTTDATTAASRLCAAALLHRLDPPTIGARVAAAFDNTVSWASRLLARGRNVRIAEGAGAATLTGVLGVEVMLFVIGLGQLFLWRAERMPGPVEAGPISPPGDDSSCTALSEIMRDRLARAGIAPGTSAPGELRAVVIDAVDAGAAAQKGWLGDALSAISRALKPSTGLTVTAKAFRDSVSKRCSITVAATVARTGASFAVLTADGDSYEDAAVSAAYQLYVRLIGRESVRQRTPIWLGWTSEQALRNYHDALARDELGDVAGAAAALATAAQHQPANVLILIRRSQCLWSAFKGTPDETVLRGTTPEGKHAVEALECALRAVVLAPRSDDALFLAAVNLIYVDEWNNAWPGLDGEQRERTAQLIERAVRTTGRTQKDWSFEDTLDPDQMAVQCREASAALARRAVRNQRYWNVLRLAWPIATRRESVDRAWPWSQVRFVRRQAALGLLDGIVWVRRRQNEEAHPRRVAIVSPLRRARIRVARRLYPDPSGVVDWNLASAYACHARALSEQPDNEGLKRDRGRIESAVRDNLTRSLLGVSHQLAEGDVDYLIAASDFRPPTRPPVGTLVEYLQKWAVPLVPETAEAREQRVRSEQLRLAFDSARRAIDIWWSRLIDLDQLLVPTDDPKHPTAAAASPPARAEVLQWFYDDYALWQALRAWTQSPSDAAKRQRVENCVSGLVAPALAIDSREELVPGQWSTHRWQTVCAVVATASSSAGSDANDFRALLVGGVAPDRLIVLPSPIAAAPHFATIAVERWSSLVTALT